MSTPALFLLCLLLSVISHISTAFDSLSGKWQTARVTSGALVPRHEACAVMVKGLVVLVGGRGVNKAVNIYDPVTGVWQTKPGPGAGIEIHHFQCVAIRWRVWIISSWTGGYPRERNNEKIYIYDVRTFTWSTRDGLPEPRRRGGGAAIRVGRYIYLIAGNRGGHGEHATSLPWMDAYDWRNDTWKTHLTSMPAEAARDHVGGAKVRGQLCIAGGRDGGSSKFFKSNAVSTYCYSLKTDTWRERANFPWPRAGAMTGRTCDGKMMIAGGEGDGVAYDRVDVFDGRKWERADDLVRARHGSGLAVSNCSCGHIFIPSGSGNQGGWPELPSTEQFVPDASPSCTTY